MTGDRARSGGRAGRAGGLVEGRAGRMAEGGVCAIECSIAIKLATITFKCTYNENHTGARSWFLCNHTRTKIVVPV